jgi:2-polyprenyl-6-methoxyphenol hydroxylase-like FAD-dependent oxidoreductase
MLREHGPHQLRRCRYEDNYSQTYLYSSFVLKVWDGVSDARLNFSASEIGLDVPEDGMARLTEILNLQRGLLRRLEDFPDIQLRERTKVKTIVRDSEERGGWPMVHLENGQILRARLLVRIPISKSQSGAHGYL